LKQTINDDYYAALLDHFNILKKKRFGEEESVLPSRQCIDSHDIDGQIQRIPLRIASPSSIFARFSRPCDYFLFPNLKKWFGRKRFITREQLIVETEAYFEGLDKSYYSDGLKKLENHHWIIGSNVSS